jgi:hypothetical protein
MCGVGFGVHQHPTLSLVPEYDPRFRVFGKMSRKKKLRV